jgi:S1-C subfamily serine protease
MDGRRDPQKLLARTAVKVKIAMASGVVLLVGWWLAPPAVQTALSVPQEHAAPLLEAQVQLRDVNRPFVGVQEVAASLWRYSVAVLAPVSAVVPGRNDYAGSAPGQRPVAGFGVFVDGTHVLTHSAALDGRAAADVSVEGRATAAQVVSYEPTTGLVLLQVQRRDASTSAPLAVDAPSPGALAVAVGRFQDRGLDRGMAVPVFVTSAGPDDYTIGAVDDALLPGMPVFNLAGELFAIAVPDGRTVRAIPVRQAAARMIARASSGERPAAFGLGFQDPTGRLTDAFGADGVIVSEVLPGGPGDVADVRVGDVLLAVGDVPVDSADVGARALGATAVGTSTTLRLRRGGRVIEVQATPAFAYEIAALARAGLDIPAGPAARVLFPVSVLEASAIPPSAQVISVNGRTMTTRAQVQRALRAARGPVPVLVRAGDHQFFATVEPAR